MSVQLSSNLVNSGSLEEFQILRQELKDWEKAVETSNDGRKASREDIKNNPEIARKYKLYNKLRGSSPQHPSKSSPAAKQKSLPSAPASTTQTPQKHTKHSHYVHPSSPDQYDAPQSARKNTPSIFRTSIGPTPQKDGRVLGIFDFLSPESEKIGTPSKNQGRTSLTSIPGNSLKTPSKKKRAQDNDDEANTPRSKRVKTSPPSILFTPSAARRTTTAAATPSSHRKLVSLDDTPAFLKRYHTSAHPLNDDAGAPISWSPEINVRMRTKPALKGLSQLVRGLREMADKELDDEMDLLRELEGDGGAPKKSNFAAKLKAATAKKMDQDLKTPSSVPTLVQDSQTGQPEQQQKPPRFPMLLPSSERVEMPLGPDRALDDESEEDSLPPQRGWGGKPLRAFKKRGQKRSTRMSKMRPSNAKWKPEPAWKVGSSDEAEKEKDEGREEKGLVVEVQVVEETQLPLPAPVVSADDDDDDDDDMLKTDNEEFIDSCPSSVFDEDEDSLSKPTSKKPKANTKAKRINIPGNPGRQPSATTSITKSITTTATTTSSTQPPNEKTEPKKKKNKKKIAATAHANFRALKIRGKGGAGGKGGKKYSKSRGRR